MGFDGLMSSPFTEGGGCGFVTTLSMIKTFGDVF
jgi:hypothetical protein